MLPWRMLVVNANNYPGKTFMVDIPFVLPRKNDSYNARTKGGSSHTVTIEQLGLNRYV